MKITLILLLSTLFFNCELFVQTDSTSLKTTFATSDARRFKPTKQIRIDYRKHSLSNTSDYFKPTIQNVSNPGLLKDSIYVKSFKNAAYKNSIRKIKFKQKIIIGSIVVAGLVALPFVVAKGLKSLLADARSTI